MLFWIDSQKEYDWVGWAGRVAVQIQLKKTLHNIDQKYNVDMDSTETKFTMYSSCAIIHKEWLSHESMGKWGINVNIIIATRLYK